MAENSNADQSRYWNEQAGPKWVAARDTLDALLRPIGDAAIARANVSHAEQILDVGCGNGRTTIELQRLCGADGAATGIDLSAPLLELARAEATRAGLARPPRFLQADAQDADLGSTPFDLVFSRFGVMFFADPVAAFGNLRRAMAATGRLVFVCWQRMDDNLWMRVPVEALRGVLELPPPGPATAPGPFAFAEPERLHGLLAAAGFASIAIESCTGPLSMGGATDLDAATGFALQVGPAASALRDAPETVRVAAFAQVREALTPYLQGGSIALPGAWFLVTARAS